MSIVRPAGTPSMIVTSALPCDSPAVKKRSMRASFYPKYLPPSDGRSAIGGVIRAGRHFAPTPVLMKLIADRFVAHEHGHAFDLATGARVMLTVGSAGGVSEQLRWSDSRHCGVGEACSWLRARRTTAPGRRSSPPR